MKELNSLQQLAEYYPARARSSLADLAAHYEHRSQKDILEIAAIAADVSADTILNLGLEPKINPLIAEAFRLQYPNVVMALYTKRGDKFSHCRTVRQEV